MTDILNNGPVYLDYNATAPARPAVIAAITAALTQTGNASSIHGFGRKARKMIEDARTQIAGLCACDRNYVTFTSGGTESNNIAIKSFSGARILVSAIEHPSVLEAAPSAERIPVTPSGLVDLGALEQMLTNGAPVALIAVMLVNNETGVIQPVADIVRLVRRVSPQTRVHCDAVQAAGKIAIDFSALQVDSLALSAHKIGGTHGVGALIIVPGADIKALIHGGGQEKRMRAGTENVAGIAAFGIAAAEAVNDLNTIQTLSDLRDQIERELSAIEPRLKIFGNDAPRVGTTTQIGLPGIPAETQLMALDLAGIAVSSGSACSSGTVKTSHVLKAMGASDNDAMGALRISMGWATTPADIDRFITAWTTMHARLKDKIKS
ncbi:cysteine desulfurase family protein [Micavibrio aeruginosavorus]|uniref:cysteine desulfurase family protein n=1 Tax=Micavibrio aeruginosavorus TaxID=349221 RepID=UPI003F4A9F6C